MQVSQDTRMRVKLYQLNENHVWEDKGTGHVTFAHSDRHNGMSLFVRSETDGSQLLDSRIEIDTVYEIQLETIIVWSEGETADLALSFQEKSGCEEVWEKIQQLQRPPFDDIGPTQYVELKKSRDVDLLQPLSRWVKSYSGVIQPQDAKAIAELMSLRKSALIDPHDNRESHLSILCRYFDQLSAMITKAPFTLKPQSDFPFRWTKTFDRKKDEFISSNVGYERASVLFNIAALQSQIARGQLHDRDSDLKVCSKLFQQSARIFNHLKEHVASMLGQESTSDLQPELHGADCALMLAQSQEALYLDALNNREPPAVIASLAQQAADAYSEAYKQMSELRFSKVVNMSAKSVRFEVIAYYHQSLIHQAAKAYGMQVACLQRAMDLFSSNVTSMQLFADYFHRIKTAYQTAKRDNDFIYHKSVPASNYLPPIEKAPLAKIQAFSQQLSEPGNFTDLFAHLVPAALNQAAARFEFERRELIASEMETLREAHASLLEKMASELMDAIRLDSLSLPASLEDAVVQVGPISSELLEAVARLRGLLSQVETLKYNRDRIDADLQLLANNGSDQKASFLRALTELGVAKEEEITKEFLAINVGVLRDDISESVEAHEYLLREIELGHAEFVRQGGALFLEQLSACSQKDCLARLEGLALDSEQSNPCPINVLPDKDLLFIFMHLTPYDRLIVSEVCKRWHEISRIPWHDVSSLDLTPIPNPNIRPIIQQCPKLKAVFALGKIFSRSELSLLSRIPLSSLKLYTCASNIISASEEDDDDWSWNLMPFVPVDNSPIAAWEELVLNGFGMPTHIDWIKTEDGSVVARDNGNRDFAFYLSGEILPTSLKRLLLSDVYLRKLLGDPWGVGVAALAYGFLQNFRHLQNLTCLILVCFTRYTHPASAAFIRLFIRELQKLSNLCELYLGRFPVKERLSFDTVALGLPRLEVLFLMNVGLTRRAAEDEDRLVPLVAKHPSLRILCIAGWFPTEHVIPVRRLFPNGYAAQPVPLLHIFLGKMAAENIVFERSSPDALKVYPITEPLPTFLEKEEIAPILKGVWIAQQIKDDAKYRCYSIHDLNEGADDVSIRIVDPE